MTIFDVTTRKTLCQNVKALQKHTISCESLKWLPLSSWTLISDNLQNNARKMISDGL